MAPSPDRLNILLPIGMAIDTQRQLFSAEINLATITRDQLNAVVQVYKALGGGWEAELPVGRSLQP